MNDKNLKKYEMMFVGEDRLRCCLAAMAEKKAEAVEVFDARLLAERMQRFLVIGAADNYPQMRAIADNVQRAMKRQFRERAYGREDGLSKGWLLLDFVDIVIHIFHPTLRTFYALEGLWPDAKRVLISEND